MSIKMKGLFKGLRYISQIFEEEKEEDLQIGIPTDVKHVAHIGLDGPSNESPSWMKGFKGPSGEQLEPLGSSRDNKEESEMKRGSEDSRRGSKVGRDLPELPRSSRRHHSDSGDSPKKKDGSTKSRHSRRSQSKESLDGSVRSSRQSQEFTGSESPARGLPDIPKKCRKKKSKEADGGGSTRSRSSKASMCPSEMGSDQEFPMMQNIAGSGLGDEDEERRVMVKEY